MQDVNKAFLQLFVAFIKLVQELGFAALEMKFTDGIEYTVKETIFICEWEFFINFLLILQKV